MEMFYLWSRQIHTELTNMAIGLVSTFVKFVAHRLPKKNIHLDYNEQHHDNEPVDHSKTIVTLDFKNLLIQTSRYARDDMTKLNVPVQRTTWQKILYWRNVGYFYKRRPGYDRFVKALNSIPNSLLYLYTVEEKPVADRLLEELRLTRYFPPQQRRYRASCKFMDNEAKKHPAYVDVLTQRYLIAQSRVIILTANVQAECDDSNESSRYFLQVPWSTDEASLMEYAYLLSDVITRNSNKQELHDQLQNEVFGRMHGDEL